MKSEVLRKWLDKLKNPQPVTTPPQPQPTPAEDWTTEIQELELFFGSVKLPETPIKLNEAETITDCHKFVDSHIATAKANNGKPAFQPYLDRIRNFKNSINI